MLRLLETLFSGRALICFRVTTVPPIAAVVIGRAWDGRPELSALREEFEGWALAQRPPPPGQPA